MLPDTGESGEAYEIDMTRAGNGPYSNNLDVYGKYKITLNVDPRLHERIVHLALDEDMNRHAFLLKLINEGIIVREKKAKQE